MTAPRILSVANFVVTSPTSPSPLNGAGRGLSGISPHVYAQRGTFVADLSVTDAKGATGTPNTITIKVR